MWKYVAFVLLIVFSASVLGQGENQTVTDLVFQNDTTTVEPPSSVTTPSTTASTEVPTSTTEASSTTTPEVTTTPEATTSKVTTVSPSPSTPLPSPDVGKYSIHEKGDENKTCLRVEMALQVSIQDLEASYNFPQNASTVGSDCNFNDTEVLKLTAEDLKQSLTLVFVQKDNKNYVQDIKFTYYTTEMKTVNTSGHFFSATQKNSYLCHSDVKVQMENVTLTFSSIHIQAFGADEFGRAEECDADDKVGDIVPIAVGCALGALVIIVLIAYLVGRRRSHQKGYQSV